MAGQMCNYTQLGGQVGLDGKTAARYVGVFEQMYLLKRIDVWARNRLNRIIKTSKLQAKTKGQTKGQPLCFKKEWDTHFVLDEWKETHLSVTGLKESGCPFVCF